MTFGYGIDATDSACKNQRRGTNMCFGDRTARLCSLLNPTSSAISRAYCTFLNLVEHHSKESTVHRFEPARPRNKAQHIAANTE